MKNILHGSLVVKVFTYESEEEMIKHNEKMTQEGWVIKKKGKCFLLPNCTITEFEKEENWTYYTEYKQEFKKEDKSKPISYETDMYWFDVFKSKKDE